METFEDETKIVRHSHRFCDLCNKEIGNYHTYCDGCQKHFCREHLKDWVEWGDPDDNVWASYCSECWKIAQPYYETYDNLHCQIFDLQLELRKQFEKLRDSKCKEG